MRVVAPDLPGRGRSDPVAHAEDYGTPALSRGDGRAHRAPRRARGRLGRHLARRPHRHGAGRAAGIADPAPGPQRLRRARARRRAAAHRPRICARAHPFATLDEVEAYLREIYAPFGDAHRRAVASHGRAQRRAGQGGHLRLHYDPAIVEQFSRPLLLDVALWRVWEHVACPMLILRGENSDLLLPATVAEMKQRGIAAAQGLVRVGRDRRLRPRARADGRRRRSGWSRTSCWPTRGAQRKRAATREAAA